MDWHFRVLDAEVVLSGPASVVDPIAAAYRRFVVEPQQLARPARVALDGLPVVSGVDPRLLLYQRFLTTLTDGIGSCALLHAAALTDPGGRAFLLAAPAGHGKSSLTLELLRRGYRFLSDDFAPLALRRRRVHPYPRAVGLLGHGEAPIPECFRAAAARADAPRLFGKSLVDPGRVLGERAMARNPAPLAHVFLLDSGSSATRIEVAGRAAAADDLERALRAIPGVEILDRQELSAMRVWQLSLDHERQPTTALSALLEGDAVLYSQKYWSDRPDFGRRPTCQPIKRREAARLLGRELLNRRRGSRLLQRYGGQVSELFVDLAGALCEAGCWQLGVGEFTETVDLIEQTVGAYVSPR